MSREMSIHELHALPDNTLLPPGHAAKLLNMSETSFDRLVATGLLEEARFEPTPRAVRWWKLKLIEAAMEAGKLGKPVRLAAKADKLAAQAASSPWPKRRG